MRPALTRKNGALKEATRGLRVREVAKTLAAGDSIQLDPQKTFHAIFLAARCVGEVRKRNELGLITGKVLDRVKGLARFDLNFFYEDWSEEGQRVVAIRTRAVSMVALIWRDERGTRAWLKARVLSDEDWAVRQTAVQELAKGWKDDPDVSELLRKYRGRA
jgi:hypothetical protein